MMKKLTLYIVVAVVLIPILLASMPLNLAHKMGNGCPVARDKCVLQCDSCMYHSVTSQSETGSLAMAGLTSTPFLFPPSLFLSKDKVDSAGTTVLNPFPDTPPLRC
jgi:hypothetical protein